MRIAVAGGSGVVGRPVVERLVEVGHQPVVLTRSEGVDLVTGRGLPGQLDGVDAVIDVANVSTLKTGEAIDFFSAVTRHLLEEESRAGVAHHVALSIVGIDGAKSGYYAGKVAQEELVKASTVPWTLLRATQFHEFAEQVVERTAMGPLVLVPRMLSAPVAAREVAERLVELATATPLRDTVEIGGPEKLQMVDLTRQLLRAQGSRKRVLPVRVPGAAGRAMREGGLLPNEPAYVGQQAFEDWLSRRISEK